ncbi:MAG: BCCT family transporter, partial [Bacteroidota bacterium]
TALPMLSKANWFSIALCTTVAVGILFWATAEPLYHFNQPPQGSGVAPRTPEAASFSLSTIFLHWTLMPYSLYTLTALMFALCHYNFRQSFQVGSVLLPVIGAERTARIAPVIDAICLFSLVAGMAASMGSGLLTLSGGYARFSGKPADALTFAILALLLTLTMAVSAASGLQRGIRMLSTVNIIGFLLLITWVVIAGPFVQILPFQLPALTEFFTQLVPRSLALGLDAKWSHNWTLFYWSNWLAWTPVVALFLGKLGRGYTIRAFIRFNLIYPSLFSMGWMALFGGYAIYFDGLPDKGLYSLLQLSGPESIIFEVLGRLPWATVWVVFYFILIFLSFVTAGDSTISAMSSLSTSGISKDRQEAPAGVTILWSVVVGLTSWFMVSQAGLDGIRLTSNLGGFPALWLYLLIIIGMFKLIVNGPPR